MNTTYEPERRPAAQELITVVAHDLRNYLTPLQCRVDLIRRRAIREERHDYLDVRVTDDGEGISPDLLPRLFEPFSTGPGSAGLGLGLYLAHQIAAAHGGSLSVDSRPGEGASFALAWPSHALETQRHATAPVI